jgi:hypothetical protein
VNEHEIIADRDGSAVGDIDGDDGNLECRAVVGGEMNSEDVSADVVSSGVANRLLGGQGTIGFAEALARNVVNSFDSPCIICNARTNLGKDFQHVLRVAVNSVVPGLEEERVAGTTSSHADKGSVSADGALQALETIRAVVIDGALEATCSHRVGSCASWTAETLEARSTGKRVVSGAAQLAFQTTITITTAVALNEETVLASVSVGAALARFRDVVLVCVQGAGDGAAATIGVAQPVGAAFTAAGFTRSGPAVDAAFENTASAHEARWATQAAASRI